MKKIIILLFLIITTTFLAGCTKKNQNSSLSDQESLPSKVTITIKNHAFNPQTIVIADGTKITWENKDGATHQIVSDSEPAEFHIKSLESWEINPYKTWTFTFDGRGFFGKAWDIKYRGQGVFHYHCKLHPEMKGTIIVQ